MYNDQARRTKLTFTQHEWYEREHASYCTAATVQKLCTRDDFSYDQAGVLYSVGGWQCQE
jgi:hypothetical protein